MILKKITAIMLALLMVVSIIPMSVFADVEYDLSKSDCDYYNIIEKNDYALAPGATESEIVINDDSGSRRNVVHVMEVDLSNPNISVMPGQKNISEDVDYTDTSNWGTQIVRDHATHAEENLGLNVVGAMNVSLTWSFTHPYGLLIYKGKVLYDDRANHSGGGYLAITKDGKAELREARAELTGDEWMAQTICFGWLVKDGKSLYPTKDHTSTGAPRSVIGIKEDGTLVLMMNDGRQSPYSEGFTNHEMAETMLALGCVDAINCDGGGSSTFITEREGTGELVMQSRPSDGSERQTLSSILVISDAVADGKFDHAALEAEDTFVTPGASVKVNATGADKSGGPAEVPEDISWQLKDASMGTVKDGVFTSNGTVGEAVVQMVYDGAVVGEDTINVVVPDTIKFAQSTITAPYGKTVDLDVTAMYGVSEVALQDDDISYELSDSALGTVSDNKFTACDASTGLTSGKITAKFADTDIACSADLVLGKASQVLYDFEEGTEDFILQAGSSYGLGADLYQVTKDTGKVYNGDGALAMEFDLTNSTFGYTGGWLQCYATSQWAELDPGAKKLGVWVYLPEIEELDGLALRLYAEDWNYNSVDVYTINPGDDLGYNGWRYISADISSFNDTWIYLAFYPMINATADGFSRNAKYTFYIDDFTVDYSSAVDDREPPVFGDISVSHDRTDDPIPVNGQVVDSNKVAFTVKATEDTTKSNYTGIDVDSAKAYIDGVMLEQGVKCTEDGLMSISDVTLPNGTHTVRFELCDNMGNKSYEEGYITIKGTSDENTISIVPSDPDLDRIPIGSLYWLDVKADAIEDVKKVSTVINLNSISTWELDHMEVAEGFEASYEIDEVTNNAKITISKTGESDLTGTAVLAKLPIRTWESDRVKNGEYTPEQMWQNKWICSMGIKISTNLGKVTFVDGSASTFSMTPVKVDTELYSNAAGMGEDYSSKTSWHQHTAVALVDKAATCTETGYTGRTFCEACNSVVEWGTTVKATGHTYEVEDGVLKCKDCDKLFNGELDGKTYVDGIALNGWVDDSYYKDGAMLKGIQAVDGVYYDFGEDGVCKNKVKYTGLYKDGDVYKYLYLGAFKNGWQMINNEWYYFDTTTNEAATGEQEIIKGVTFEFEETGRLVNGAWYKDSIGYKYYYGPDCYEDCFADIDGERYYFAGVYRYEKGIHGIKGSVGNDTLAYEFGKNGVLIGEYKGTGLVVASEGTYYFIDGVAQTGLHFVDGKYYYFHALYGWSYAYRTYNVTDLNGYNFTPGTYEFDENGAIIDKNGYYEENGVNYYYINNVRIRSKLVKIDGEYYYLDAEGQIFKDGKVYVSSSACDLPAKANYYFGVDGKALNGVIDGKLYTNGQLAPTGLHKVGDDYYYSESGKVIVDRKYYASKTNCDLAAKAYYYFDTEGKALKGVVDGKLYIKGQVAPTGLTQYGEDYYYSESGKVIVDRRYYAAKTNCDLAAKDYYYFGADGKMLQGVVDGKLYINGQPAKRGLTKFGDDYYYSESGKVIVDRRYYATLSNCDLPAKEYYFFGADGKMLQGVVDGKLYIKGQIAPTGLTKYADDYYYSESGKVIVDKRYYAAKTNCDLAAKDYYFFGADGKMLQGVVDGKLYIKGQIAPTGLTKYAGDYYYSESGKAVTGKYYAAKTNCDLAADTYYYFGEDSKMLEGVVDGKLYIGGQIAPTGLTKYAGDYYYSESGKVVTGKYYASKTNCDLAAKDYYFFGEDGKMLEGVVDGYLYLGGKRAPTGLTKYGKNYYYSQSGKLATGKCYASVTNCDLPAKEYYYFDEDGTFRNGVYTETDGVYYYEAGKRVFAGLVEVDGSFYYAGSGGKCLRSTKQLCLKSSCVLPINREYTFGADGKMVK